MATQNLDSEDMSPQQFEEGIQIDPQIGEEL
jgi:hypothetical protein